MSSMYCEMSFQSKVLGYRTDLHAIIPYADNVGDEQRYQVLYLLHGGHGDDTDFLRYSQLEQYADKNMVALIMPSCQNSFYQDMYYGASFFTYITEELPQTCQRQFPISRKREHTFIGGVSMGGYGALRAAFTKPECYSRAISIAGAIDFSAAMYESIHHLVSNPFKPYSLAKDPKHLTDSSSDLIALAKQLKKQGKEIPPLYLRTGRQDIFCHHMNTALHQPLVELGADLNYDEADAEHTWEYWANCLPLALDWLPLARQAVRE